MHLTISFHKEKLYIWLFIIQIDTFGKWLRLSAKSLLSKTEKNSDIWANSDNLSPVKPLALRETFMRQKHSSIPESQLYY